MKLFNPKYRQKLFAYIGLGIVTLIVGLSFIFVKISLRSANTYDLLAHRFSFAFFMVIVAKIFGIVKIPKVSTKDWLLILLLSLFYPILFFGFQTIGMETSTASQAGIIFALSPIFTIIAGTIFLREKTTFLQKLGVTVSVASLVFIFLYKSGPESQSLGGVFFLVLSVSCVVAYYMLGKDLMKRYDSLSLASLMIAVAFVIFNTIAVARHYLNGDLSTFFKPLNEPSFLYSVLYLGVLSSLVTSFLSNYALVHIPTSEISTFNNLNPVITILGGVLILNEQLYIFQILGSLGVLFGVMLVLKHKHKSAQQMKILNTKDLSSTD